LGLLAGDILCQIHSEQTDDSAATGQTALRLISGLHVFHMQLGHSLNSVDFFLISI